MKKVPIVLVLFMLSLPASAADVRATWDAVTVDEQGGQETVDHYVLYWGQASRPGSVTRPGDPNFSYAQSQNVGNVTSSQQSGFNPGQTYYFAVAAVDIAGNTSAYSAEVPVTIPSDQDGGVDAGTDGGGQDAGGDEPGADSGGEEEIVVEGSCGCDAGTGTRAGTGTGFWIVAMLVLPFIRRKRE